MSAIREFIPHYTIKDYERWEGRWELINGIAIAMSPMPSPRHQEISGAMTEILRQAVKQSACAHCRVYQPIDYYINNDTIINPDLLIVCKPIEGQYLKFPPELVVEILSPSTAIKDKNTKFDIYQNEGVPYYLILDPEQESVDIFQLKNGMYELTTTNQFQLEDCTISIDVSQAFII
ncbi:MAG: Uma2 family endonuclease [Saprospiraceae bacterium]|nr:Uma2 family endonuclease [Saprospiraceae bacterium]